MSEADRDQADVGRVVVLGAGAMGSLFGGTLARGGLNVTLVDPDLEHVEAINDNGLTIEGHGGLRTVHVAAVSRAAGLAPPEVVLVQCKALHTHAAVTDGAALFGRSTTVISFQNGLGNEELIGEIIGADKVVAGLTAQGATRVRPGVVHNFGELPSYIGERQGGVSARVRRIASAFTAAGLDTRASDDIRREKWKKLLGNVGLSPTSAITNLTSTQLMAIPQMRATVFGAVDEAAAVGAAEGVELDVEEARSVLMALVDTRSGGTGNSKSSACVDILNGRRTEVDFINGAIVRLGEKHAIATPINATLVAAVKGLEAHFG